MPMKVKVGTTVMKKDAAFTQRAGAMLGVVLGLAKWRTGQSSGHTATVRWSSGAVERLSASALVAAADVIAAALTNPSDARWRAVCFPRPE